MDLAEPLTCDPSARYWDRETDTELVCLAVRADTHDIATFTFAGAEGQYFAFAPGQYFSFTVPLADGREEIRCYSISSSALRPRTVSVTVKRVPGGQVSNRLHDHLKPGDRVRAMGPLGTFGLPDAAPDKLLLLSGGSGITPMMAIARTLADAGRAPDLVFLHAARTPADFAFRDDLRVLARAMPGFRPVLVAERGDAGHAGLVGRISPAMLAAAVPDLAERRVLCCGPAGFMAAARAICAAAGVPADRYAEESFDAPAEAPAEAIAPATGHSAVFSRQGRTITVGAGQSILAAARAQGIVLPSSCANGLCGTCKSRLVTGEVEMRHNGGIRQREIDAGFILPCCATPLGDVVIDR